MTAEVFKFQMYYNLSQWQLETRVLIEVKLKLSYLEGNKGFLHNVYTDRNILVNFLQVVI